MPCVAWEWPGATKQRGPYGGRATPRRREPVFRSRISRFRPIAAAAVATAILALTTAAVALAGGGGAPWPK
jgi:hypothetical protein